MSSLHEALKTKGAVQLRSGEHPYSPDDVRTVARLCQRMPRAEGMGDINRVNVGRLVVDPVDIVREQMGHAPPSVVDGELAREILDVVASDEALSHWRGALDLETLAVRRAQANFLDQGGEVGFHTDHESNPDYRVSVILGLSDDYTGGEFLAEVTPGEIRRFRVERGDVLLVRSELPHAVSRIESGTRVSVVMFMA